MDQPSPDRLTGTATVWTAGSSPAGRGGRRPGWQLPVAGVAAAVLLVVAVVGIRAAVAPRQVTVTGTFTVLVTSGVLDSLLGDGTAQSQMDQLTGIMSGQSYDCPRLSGGFSDIGTGTQVRVEDAAGVLLGVGTLTGGVASKDYGGCRYEFEVVADRAELYQVEVASRGQVAFRHDELEAGGWQVSLTL